MQDKLCPRCKQVITPEYQEIINGRKRQNAINSVAKAKARGNKLGPKRRCNIEKVVALREKGMSYRKIGKIMGFSATTIHRAYLQAPKN